VAVNWRMMPDFVRHVEQRQVDQSVDIVAMNWRMMPDFVRHVEQRQVDQTVSRFWVLTSMTLGMKVSLTDLISVKKKSG